VYKQLVVIIFFDIFLTMSKRKRYKKNYHL